MALRDATQRSARHPGVASFLSSTQGGRGEDDLWDALVPQPLASDDPFAAWQDCHPAAGSSSWHDQRYSAEESYAVNEIDDDSSSSSATSSDDGHEDTGMPDLSQLSNAEAAESIYYQYRAAKRNWRRFTGRPVRRFRRVFKHNYKRRGKGNGKGRGRGRTRGFFYTNDDVQVFLKGRGKGHRAHTSGKGHGRHKNPKDRDGNIMKCRICESEEHLMARCPQNKGKGKGSSSSTPPGFTAWTLPEPASSSHSRGDGRPMSEITTDHARTPWDDDSFDAPRETFAAFMIGTVNANSVA